MSGVLEVESVSRGRLEAVIELSVPLWLFSLKRWWWWWWWEPLGLLGVVCFASRGRRGWDPFWVGGFRTLLFRLQDFVSGPESLEIR